MLVVYTVDCAQHVAHQIAAGEDDTHVIGFPGCYDNAYAVRLLNKRPEHRPFALTVSGLPGIMLVAVCFRHSKLPLRNA